MKNSYLLSLVGLLLLLSGCKTVTDSRFVTIEQLSRLHAAPPLQTNRVSITCRVVASDGSIVKLPKITTRIGKKASVNVSKEFIYPTAYDLPEAAVAMSNDDGNLVPVNPASPTAFETLMIGDNFTVTPRIRGAFIELSGALTSKTVDISTRSGGEAYLPIMDTNGRIILSKNYVAAPEFKQVESTIRVCGRPGVEHKVHLNTQNRDVFITIDIVD